MRYTLDSSLYSFAERITKADLLPLVLTPLMGGVTSQKERIMAAYRITRHVTTLTGSDIQKVEAMIYAMADKFLDETELEQLKKEIKMTRLGQMLMEEGRVEGRAEGRVEGREEEREQAIRILVHTYRKFGASKMDAIQAISAEYDKSSSDSAKDVDKYWD